VNVVYSAPTTLGGGGIGVDVYTAVHALYGEGYLKKGIVYRNRQKEIPESFIKSIRINPTKIFSSLPARYYYPIKRKYLDLTTKKIIKNGRIDSIFITSES
jgi:hypothetical protein